MTKDADVAPSTAVDVGVSPNGVTDTDGWLVLLKARDTAVVQEWVDLYHHDVYRFMRHLTRHVETAEDLTQQSFINAWKYLDGFDGRSSMRVWLHRIAYREYARWRTKHRLLAPLEAVFDREAKREPLVARFALEAALERLSAIHREVFLLVEVQGLTMEEVATVSGISVGTVKSRLHHAKKKLRMCLSEEGEDGE